MEQRCQRVRSPAPLVPSAAFRSHTPAIARSGTSGETRSTRHPSPRPPSASRLLPAGRQQHVRKTRCAQAGARAIERVALANRAETQFDTRTVEADGCVLTTEVHHVEPDHGTRRGNCASGPGTRPSRRRKPQQRLSGMVVMSKAPQVSRCSRWQSSSKSIRCCDTETGRRRRAAIQG